MAAMRPRTRRSLGSSAGVASENGTPRRRSMRVAAEGNSLKEENSEDTFGTDIVIAPSSDNSAMQLFSYQVSRVHRILRFTLS